MEFEKGPNRYFKNDDAGKLIGEVTFEQINNDSVIVIEHTFVNPAYRHQGIAAQLVQKVIDQARAENKLINPVCPYAKSMFMKTPELKDLWYKHN